MDLHNKLNLLSLNCNGFKNKANIILDTYPNIDFLFSGTLAFLSGMFYVQYQ